MPPKRAVLSRSVRDIKVSHGRRGANKKKASSINPRLASIISELHKSTKGGTEDLPAIVNNDAKIISQLRSGRKKLESADEVVDTDAKEEQDGDEVEDSDSIDDVFDGDYPRVLLLKTIFVRC